MREFISISDPGPLIPTPNTQDEPQCSDGSFVRSPELQESAKLCQNLKTTTTTTPQQQNILRNNKCCFNSLKKNISERLLRILLTFSALYMCAGSTYSDIIN